MMIQSGLFGGVDTENITLFVNEARMIGLLIIMIRISCFLLLLFFIQPLVATFVALKLPSVGHAPALVCWATSTLSASGCRGLALLDLIISTIIDAYFGLSRQPTNSPVHGKSDHTSQYLSSIGREIVPPREYLSSFLLQRRL